MTPEPCNDPGCGCHSAAPERDLSPAAEAALNEPASARPFTAFYEMLGLSPAEVAAARAAGGAAPAPDPEPEGDESPAGGLFGGLLDFISERLEDREATVRAAHRSSELLTAAAQLASVENPESAIEWIAWGTSAGKGGIQMRDREGQFLPDEVCEPVQAVDSQQVLQWVGQLAQAQAYLVRVAAAAREAGY